MNRYLLIMTAGLVTAVVAGCGQRRPLDNATVNSRLDPNDKQIVALVSWLKHNGVTLEFTTTAEGYGEWKVTDPKTSDELGEREKQT